MSPLVPYALESVRRNLGALKLMIDDRIPLRNSIFGRNLMTGVPNTCQTVKDFKTHLSRVYLQNSTPFLLFQDEFCIPDDEDAGLLTSLKDPVRVVPVGELRNYGTSNPSSILKSTTPIKRPHSSQNLDIILPSVSQSAPSKLKKIRFETSTPNWKVDSSSKKSKSRKRDTDREETLSPEVFTGTGVDEIDHDILQCSILNESPIPSPSKKLTSSSDSMDSVRLTASAKRRLRLRKALEKAMDSDSSKATSLVSKDQSEIITPETNESGFIVTPISRKQVTSKAQTTQQAKKSHSRNSFSMSDSLELLGKMSPNNTFPWTTKKRPSTARFESPPSKLEKSTKTDRNIPSGDTRRPDTPRMPKSLKNPAALEIFKQLEFSSDGKNSTSTPTKSIKKGNSAGAAYLQDTFKKLVQNLDAESASDTLDIESKQLQRDGPTPETIATIEEDNQVYQEAEKTIPETSNGTVVTAGGYKYDDDDSQGATGPLDPLYYETLTPLLSIDDVPENSIIAFKHLEMDDKGLARISEFKEALVTRKSESDLNLEYLKTSSTTPSEKFEIEGYLTEDLQNPRTISFSLLMTPKLVRGPAIADGSG